jgi:hypothetical protein
VELDCVGESGTVLDGREWGAKVSEEVVIPVDDVRGDSLE